MTHYGKTQEAVNGLEWPCEMDISQESVFAYEKAIDVVDGAHEEIDQLVKALHLFASCGSYPLAAAGVAYTLVAASRQGHGKYVHAGLKAAQVLLNQAREIVDDRIEINFVQLFIDLAYENYAQYQRRYLSRGFFAEDDYHVQLARLYYQCKNQHEERRESQYEKVTKLASTKNQKVLVNRHMAYHYLWAMRVFRTLGSVLHVSARDEVGEYGQKTKYYLDEIHKLSPDDPYLWHDYSMLHYLQGNYFKAAHYNKKVLKTKSFQGALAIREKLKKRLFLLYYFA